MTIRELLVTNTTTGLLISNEQLKGSYKIVFKIVDKRNGTTEYTCKVLITYNDLFKKKNPENIKKNQTIVPLKPEPVL